MGLVVAGLCLGVWPLPLAPLIGLRPGDCPAALRPLQSPPRPSGTSCEAGVVLACVQGHLAQAWPSAWARVPCPGQPGRAGHCQQEDPSEQVDGGSGEGR